jgi:hypothetical protein
MIHFILFCEFVKPSYLKPKKQFKEQKTEKNSKIDRDVSAACTFERAHQSLGEGKTKQSPRLRIS